MVDKTDKLVIALMQYRKGKKVPRERVSRETGVSVASVYRWEKGLSSPTGLSRATLKKYLRKNGVNLSKD